MRGLAVQAVAAEGISTMAGAGAAARTDRLVLRRAAAARRNRCTAALPPHRPTGRVSLSCIPPSHHISPSHLHTIRPSHHPTISHHISPYLTISHHTSPSLSHHPAGLLSLLSRARAGIPSDSHRSAQCIVCSLSLPLSLPLSLLCRSPLWSHYGPTMVPLCTALSSHLASLDLSLPAQHGNTCPSSPCIACLHATVHQAHHQAQGWVEAQRRRIKGWIASISNGVPSRPGIEGGIPSYPLAGRVAQRLPA